MSKFKSFETERLTLIPISEDDAAFLLELFNTPKWLKYIGDRNIRTVDDARTYVREKIRLQLERLGFASYTIVQKSDGQKIGMCGLYDRVGLEGIDIGFALLPEFEQKGFAFEAVNRLKQAAFDEFGLTEILAITLPENVSSQKLLEKLGLNYVGLFRLPNDNEDLFLYRIYSSI
jgi:RimJ/RimL family protein N-acetyltransferase